jgi:superfamily II DNA or RNA helicase
MYSDFESYADKGFEVENFVHKIFGGQEKVTDKPIIISTWQSLYDLKKDFFTDFKLVIGDEAHLYKAKSLTKIMKNLEKGENLSRKKHYHRLPYDVLFLNILKK